MKLSGTNAKLTIKALDVTICSGGEGDGEEIGRAAGMLADVLSGTLGVNHGELANRRAGERLARDLNMLGYTVEPALRDRCRT